MRKAHNVVFPSHHPVAVAIVSFDDEQVRSWTLRKGRGDGMAEIHPGLGLSGLMRDPKTCLATSTGFSPAADIQEATPFQTFDFDLRLPKSGHVFMGPGTAEIGT